jgi:hypothetical protein
MSMAPTGVHPADQTTPADQLAGVEGPPGGLDQPGPAYVTGVKSFAIKNDAALAVFQRLGDTAVTRLFVVSSAGPGSGTAKIVGRTSGRTSLDLWVPAQVPSGSGTMIPTPAGVIFGFDEGEIQQTSNGVGNLGGAVLNVGDAVKINAESAVWVAPQPGQTIGYVYMLHAFDIPGARSGLNTD